jgi:hypothetical protein
MLLEAKLLVQPFMPDRSKGMDMTCKSMIGVGPEANNTTSENNTSQET